MLVDKRTVFSIQRKASIRAQKVGGDLRVDGSKGCDLIVTRAPVSSRDGHAMRVLRRGGCGGKVSLGPG